VVCAAIAGACSSTSTSVGAPSGTKCSVAVTNAPATPFPSSGGNGTIGVSTTRDCTWTASADSSWVSVTPTTGQGDGTVGFSVSANGVPSPRSGAIVISSARVSLSQAAAPCRFDLSRTADTVDSSGGRLSVDVVTLAGCAWTATSAVGWIAVESGKTGNANGTVVLNVGANSGPDRVGQVTIAGQSYSVTQGAVGSGAPPPPPGSATAVGVSGRVQNISGRCPVIRFELGGTTVITTPDTDFRKMKCTDVKKDVRLTVQGFTQPDGTVLATRVAKTD
jgi:Domain of unknown function (DUF5666)/Viral BACON domain/Putative binding domain, N-terminal